MKLFYYDDFTHYEHSSPSISKSLDISEINEAQFILAMLTLQPLGDIDPRKTINYGKSIFSGMFSIQNNNLIVPSNVLSAETSFKIHLSFIMGMLVTGVYLNQHGLLNAWHHFNKFKNNFIITNNYSKKKNLHPDIICINYKNNSIKIVDAKGTLSPAKNGILEKKTIKHGIEQVEFIKSIKSAVPSVNYTIDSRLVIGVGIDNTSNTSGHEVMVHVVDPVEPENGIEIFIFPNILQVLRHKMIIELLNLSTATELEIKSIKFICYPIDEKISIIMAKEQFLTEQDILTKFEKFILSTPDKRVLTTEFKKYMEYINYNTNFSNEKVLAQDNVRLNKSKKLSSELKNKFKKLEHLNRGTITTFEQYEHMVTLVTQKNLIDIEQKVEIPTGGYAKIDDSITLSQSADGVYILSNIELEKLA